MFKLKTFNCIGANPIWDPDSGPVAPRDTYLTDLDRKNGKFNSVYRENEDDGDTASQSSGDSVLIGVENQKEFSGFKERVSCPGRKLEKGFFTQPTPTIFSS